MAARSSLGVIKWADPARSEGLKRSSIISLMSAISVICGRMLPHSAIAILMSRRQYVKMQAAMIGLEPGYRLVKDFNREIPPPGVHSFSGEYLFAMAFISHGFDHSARKTALVCIESVFGAPPHGSRWYRTGRNFEKFYLLFRGQLSNFRGFLSIGHSFFPWACVLTGSHRVKRNIGPCRTSPKCNEP